MTNEANVESQPEISSFINGLGLHDSDISKGQGSARSLILFKLLCGDRKNTQEKFKKYTQ